MNKTWIRLLLFFLALYLICGGGHIYINDDRSEFNALQSWVEGRGFALDLIDGVPGRGEKTYSKYGYFCLVKSLPFYLFGKLFWPGYFQTTQSGDYPLGPYFWFCLQNAFWGAGAVLLFYLLAGKLFASITALILSLLFGLSTMFLVYAKQTYTEVFLTLALLGSVYLLWFKPGRFAPWGAGILMGMALGLRPANLLYPLLCTLVLSFSPADRRKLPAFWLPVLAFGLGYLGYNFYRFGDFLNFGYGGEKFSVPLLTGLYGLLLSPGKGIFLYNLLLIPALWGMKELKSRSSQLFRLTLTLSCGMLLFYSKWWSWYGGHSWGPRFLLPVVPLLLLPLGFVLESRRAKGWIYGLALTGCLLQLPGVLICYQDYFFNTPSILPYPAQRIPDPLMDKINFNPAFSPLTGNCWTLTRILKINCGGFPQFNPQQAIAAGGKSLDFWWVRMKDYTPIKGSLNCLSALLGLTALFSLARLGKELCGRKEGSQGEAVNRAS